jgi:hypothetical protein
MHRCSPREKGNQIFECRFTTHFCRWIPYRLNVCLLRPTVVRAFAAFGTFFAPDCHDFREQIRRPSEAGALSPPLLSDLQVLGGVSSIAVSNADSIDITRYPDLPSQTVKA